MTRSVLLACMLASCVTPVFAQSAESKFVWQQLSPGVYVVEANSMGSNSLVVIGDTAVMLVDSQIAPASARLLLDELESVTDLPITHIVNTHWHLDHVGGNETIRRRHPRLTVLAHTRAPEGGREGGEALRERALDFWRGALGDNLRRVDSLSLSELHEPYEFHPDVLIDDAMYVDLGGRIVEVLAMPGGHTAGDLVVHLPAEHIVATGDLVLSILFASNGYPGTHLFSLQAVIDLGPETIVPGHGSVLTEPGLITDQIEQLSALRAAVLEAIEGGDDEDSVVVSLASKAGGALGDPEGLIRAIIRERLAQPTD